jgi:hypothetical protein
MRYMLKNEELKHKGDVPLYPHDVEGCDRCIRLSYQKKEGYDEIGI